jgi:hypothetical protein
LARDFLDLDIGQASGVEYSTGRHEAADAGGDALAAGVSRANPKLSDRGQNERRREENQVTQIHPHKRGHVHDSNSPFSGKSLKFKMAGK